MKSIKISKLAEELDLEVVLKSSDYNLKAISSHEVNRPGLQLSGYLDDFPHRSLQIIGSLEYEYYMSLPEDLRFERFKNFLSYPIPAIIFSNGNDISDDVLTLGRYYNKTIFRSNRPTTKLIEKVSAVLDEYLAEEVTIHAELLEVYGMGVLIMGDSSIGKSETALDLVTRGHRLVADDVVDVIKVEAGLKGSCPENMRHFLEIRGIGIIDIQRLYGVGSVKTSTSVDIVISLEKWDDNKEYDRLGLDEEFTEILGIKLPKLIVPVKPGRNVAMILEVAVRNLRQKSLGYNAAVELNNRLIKSMQNEDE